MTNEPKFKVGDHVEVNPSPVEGDYGVEWPMPFTTILTEGLDDDGQYADEEWYYLEDMLTLVERPGIGSVIKFEDIRVGDTVRAVESYKGIDYNSTLTVHNRTHLTVSSFLGGSIAKNEDRTWYLINRPEQDPEVEAIMTALDVDADTASEYHSKGIRVVSD